MSDLRPCPFCGTKPEILSDGRRTWGLLEHKGGCLFPPFPKHEIPESDFDAWNERHRETCENISDPPEGFLCSSCGWGDFDEPSHLLTTAKFTGRDHGGPNFCPNCGAEVER